jgi:hypothetical protein
MSKITRKLRNIIKEYVSLVLEGGHGGEPLTIWMSDDTKYFFKHIEDYEKMRADQARRKELPTLQQIADFIIKGDKLARVGADGKRPLAGYRDLWEKALKYLQNPMLEQTMFEHGLTELDVERTIMSILQANFSPAGGFKMLLGAPMGPRESFYKDSAAPAVSPGVVSKAR